jgi:hypothetical protein
MEDEEGRCWGDEGCGGGDEVGRLKREGEE